MTREEAIEYLNTLYIALAAFPNQKISLGNVDEIKESVSMAIEALEQEPVLDKIRAEIEDLDTHYDNDYFVGNKDAMFKCDEVMQIIDKYRGEADCHSCKTEHDCYECEKYGENEG